MRIYIKIEDLAANALIELATKKNRREILFSQLDAYGTKVIEILNQNEETAAALAVSRESQQALVDDYGDYFEPYCNEDGVHGIRLRDKWEPIDLWKRFCASFSTKLLMAFQAESAIQSLGL